VVVPRAVVVAMMPGAAGVAAIFLLPLGLAPFGFFFGFFGFDFLAELFVFGVFGFAAFAFFVVDFFDRDRFAFAVVRFGFVFFRSGKERHIGGGGQARGVSRRRGSEQQQRGEQEDQQDREFPHGSYIGAESDSA
jgi:hypothetical protein